MNFGIIQFPGSNCDQDAYHALANVLGQPTRYIWHKDSALGAVDCVVVPGGFSYGDFSGPVPSRASHRPCRRLRPMPKPEAWSSASATGFKFSAKPNYCLVH